GRRAVQPVAATPSEHTTSGLTDEDVLVRAQAAKNGAKFRALWNGDTNGHHNDDSAADLALCDYLAFWTGKDAEQMDRLFRQSKLMREKWDSPRPGGTYGSMTIRKAITDREEVYTPRTENGLNDTTTSTKRLVL